MPGLSILADENLLTDCGPILFNCLASIRGLEPLLAAWPIHCQLAVFKSMAGLFSFALTQAN